MTQLLTTFGETLALLYHALEIFHRGSKFVFIHEAENASALTFASKLTAESLSFLRAIEKNFTVLLRFKDDLLCKE